MGIFIWLIFGAIAGWVASLITNTSEKQTSIGNIVVGIIGALVGGLIAKGLGGHGITGFNLPSLLVAIAGAAIFISVFRTIIGAKA